MATESKKGERHMFNEEFSNNRIELSGKFARLDQTFTNAFGQTYAEIMIESVRKSEIVDFVPVIIPIWEIENWEIGDFIQIEGEIRSLNYVDEDGKSHLKIYVHALRTHDLSAANEMPQEMNNVSITMAYLVKPPVYRETPFGREISDVFVAVHRAGRRRSDYLPCIVWGRNASFAKNLEVGDCIQLEQGRFQSRKYTKTEPNGEEMEKTTFEISFGVIMKI